MIKEKAKIRSVVMRTWYKQPIIRLILDFPLAEIDSKVYPRLSEFVGKTMWIKVSDIPFDQKKLGEFEEVKE